MLSQNSIIALSEENKCKLDVGIQNALAASYEDYLGQVVTYLEPLQQQLYQDKSLWEKMVNRVEYTP